MNYNDLFGGSGSSSGLLSLTLNFSQSGSWQAPFDCDVVIAGVGAGGGGAGGNIGLGGNSAPWALKKVSLLAGQTLTMTNGAGGLGGTGAAGSTGATSTVAQSGVGTILTITGGEGGTYSAALVATNPAAIASSVTGADVWFPGLQSGAQTASNLGRTGGAAVNISGDGTGRSPNLNSSGSTCGGSVGITPTVNNTLAKDALPLTNFGAFGLIPAGSLLIGKGADGTGGAVLDAAPFGGGGGTTGGAGGIGGYGGGGGGGSTTGGRGGSAYFSLNISQKA